MSEETDPLEAELGALKPRAISPELRHAVETRVAGSPARRWLRAIAWVAPFVGAAILAFALPNRKELPPPPPAIEPPPAATVPDSPAPSVLAYERALARSPDEFDALLDRHAATGPGPVTTAGFPRSPAALAAFLGDN